MRLFDDVLWRELVDIIEEHDNLIWTLSRNKKNVVNEMDDEGLWVTTVNVPKRVEKEWIKNAWNTLQEKGRLKADDIPGQGRHRSSFILALLVLHPDVSIYKNRPLELTLSCDTMN